jgi:hypothetical protein
VVHIGAKQPPSDAYPAVSGGRFRTKTATWVPPSMHTRASTNAGLDLRPPPVSLVANLETRRIVGTSAADADSSGLRFRMNSGTTPAPA